ncbi:hypothetical protein VF21_07333 [Pseudogymnoascus sp. 05NY08]|nr:hypothetical protein VF21_07333 [Pseudogymnoascus sp. 05NY08]
MDELLEIEEWPEHNPPHPDFNLCLVKFMACKICLKLRSRTKFCTIFKAYFCSRRNAQEGSEKGVMKWRQQQVCLPCAAATGIYDYTETDGWYMTEDEVYWHMCYKCNRFSKDLQIISEEWVCESCQDTLEE